MNRDRGRIKWTAMMLPEHIKELKKWKEEPEEPVQIIHDEQQLEEWAYRVKEAEEKDRMLAVSHYADGVLHTDTGNVRVTETAGRQAIILLKRDSVAKQIAICNIKSISDFE